MISQSQQFKTIVVDDTADRLLKMLLTQDDLQKCNVCAVLNLVQSEQLLPTLMASGISKIIFIIDNVSVPVIVGILNKSANCQVKIIVIDELKCQLSEQKEQNPSQINAVQCFQKLVYKTNQQFTAPTLKNLLFMIQSAPSKFQEVLPISSLEIIGKRDRTDFQQVEQLIKQNCHVGTSSKGIHLQVIQDFYQPLSLMYADLLIQISPVLDKVFAGEDDLLKELKEESNTTHAAHDFILQTDPLLKLDFQQVIQLSQSEIQKLQLKEKEILSTQNVLLIKKFEEEKERFQKHLKAQKFILEYLKFNQYVDVMKFIQLLESKQVDDLVQQVQKLQIDQKCYQVAKRVTQIIEQTQKLSSQQIEQLKQLNIQVTQQNIQQQQKSFFQQDVVSLTDYLSGKPFGQRQNETVSSVKIQEVEEEEKAILVLGGFLLLPEAAFFEV